MVSDKVSKSTNSLSKLRALLTQDEAGLESYLYPKLTFGDVWWIPDHITNFSKTKERHPWVIVNGYLPLVTSVIVSPRTSTYKPAEIKRSILTAANILPGLDKDGLLILRHRRTLSATQFSSSEFEYIGKLPEIILDEITDFQLKLIKQKISNG